jgi:tripartite-type tricarboxylate transporter receptor subunit TctC
MQRPHRKFLRFAMGALALPFLPRSAFSLDYPTRQVRWIVGYAAGGGTDIFARLVAQPLSERLGQPFIIENRAGAASTVATEAVIRAPADGYMLLGTDAAAAINAALFDHLNYNFIRDMALIGVIRTSLVMLLHPSVPAKTVPEFIAYTKTNPGKIAYASSGVGTPLHAAGEMFKIMAAVSMTHVPYRGAGPALVDLLGGQVQVMFGGAPPALEHIRSGKLRALAVTTATRLELLPDIPSLTDYVPGYDASQWYCAGLRKRTSVEIVNKLNQEINTALSDPKMKVRIADLGATALLESPDELEKFLAEETEKWAKVIQAAGIKGE